MRTPEQVAERGRDAGTNRVPALARMLAAGAAALPIGYFTIAALDGYLAEPIVVALVLGTPALAIAAFGPRPSTFRPVAVVTAASLASIGAYGFLIGGLALLPSAVLLLAAAVHPGPGGPLRTRIAAALLTAVAACSAYLLFGDLLVG